MIISKWILKKYGGAVDWIYMAPNRDQWHLFWARQWIFGLNKSLGYSMELLNNDHFICHSFFSSNHISRLFAFKIWIPCVGITDHVLNIVSSVTLTTMDESHDINSVILNFYWSFYSGRRTAKKIERHSELLTNRLIDHCTDLRWCSFERFYCTWCKWKRCAFDVFRRGTRRIQVPWYMWRITATVGLFVEDDNFIILRKIQPSQI